MLQTMINAWKIADLRKKILFTAFILLVFRIGSAITIPFVDIGPGGILGDAANQGTFLAYLNMLTGDAFNFATILAMSITPYINSSIIMQLLTVAIPALERLQKEGEEGRKKIATITRYVTIGLAILQSTAYYIFLRNGGAGESATFLLTNQYGNLYTGFSAFLQGAVIVTVLTAGAGLTMWLGERINVSGIGNGVSIILFAGIIARIPQMVQQLYGPVNGYIALGGVWIPMSIIAGLSILASIAFIVWMDNAERRIPVQYTKHVVGRKMYGGQSSHIPIKVNMTGVLPIIFASSILSLPPTIGMFVTPTEGSFWYGFLNAFRFDSPWYLLMYFLMIIGFAYFYASIQYDPTEMSNNIRNNHGMIPGYRPGEPTVAYIRRILNHVTLLGALMLSAVALFPVAFSLVSALIIQGVFGQQGTMQIALGGTSVIIMVGVALETVKQLESQMMLRHYKGFLD